MMNDTHQLPTPTPAPHLPAPHLPAYPTASDAAGEVLALVLNETHFPTAERMAALRERMESFNDPTSAGALDTLRAQLATLDALFQRLTCESIQARNPARSALLLKAALNAQQAFARTFALLHTLTREAQNAAAIEMDDEP